ncbi:MAG: LamG domain-containing protein, partial [Parcubacteria group bacterium]
MFSQLKSKINLDTAKNRQRRKLFVADLYIVFKNKLFFLLALIVAVSGSVFFFNTQAVSADLYTKLLIHSDGDASSSQHNITSYNNPVFDAATKKFGGSSIKFNGSGSYLNSSDSDDWSFDSGDFTIDMWVRFDSVDNTWSALAGQSGLAPTRGWALAYNNTNGLAFQHSTNGTDWITDYFAWTPSVSTWYHIALVRTGDNLKAFVDGSQIGSDASMTGVIYNNTSSLGIGTYGDYLGDYLNGRIDEFRISKGVARWTSGFTPSTSSYATDANTKLLLHFDGDSSGQNHDMTFNGDMDSNAANSKFDGSYYFDGNGDYLSLPDSDDWNFGGGDFTIDLWTKFNSLTDQGILGQQNLSDSANNRFILSFNNLQKRLYFNISSGGPLMTMYTSWNPSANTWYHLAVSKNNGEWHMFINGAAQYIEGNTNIQMPDLNGILTVGHHITGSGADLYYNGYIDELRVSKGVARWIDNFAVPTVPYENDSVYLPAVTTVSIANLNSITATGNANLTATGGENPERFIQYSIVSN